MVIKQLSPTEKIEEALSFIDSFLEDKEGGDDVIENWDGHTPRDLLKGIRRDLVGFTDADRKNAKKSYTRPN